MIVDGQLDSVPEAAFYNAGAIEEVLEAAEKDGGGALMNSFRLHIFAADRVLFRGRLRLPDRAQQPWASTACRRITAT